MLVSESRETTDSSASAPSPHVWHLMTPDAALTQTRSDGNQGLSADEAALRLQLYGPNQLEERAGRGPLAILIEQLTNPLVLLLIFAAVISGLLGKADNVIAISAIVIINAVLGVVQEYRAEKAMAALKQMAAPLVRVRRDGKLQDIASRDLVPGDIVVLEAGSVGPADARILESANLRVQEASLTGESLPVDKLAAALTDADAPLGDRKNMLYMGTSVTYGRGVAVVVETGMKTQLGRIAELIQSVTGEKTPLQRRMDELGRVLIVAALVVMAIAFVVGLAAGDSIDQVLLNAVAIAVAVVPEGLPAVVTIALALGAQRMLRRNALIRKLPAVETLGSVTTIASDKTGTLTENRMTATVVDVAGRVSEISEVVRQPFSERLGANGSGPAYSGAQIITLLGGALANDAELEVNLDAPHGWAPVGDPTEGALVVAAARFGINKPDIEEDFPRIGEVPFESDRKRMSTLHRITRGNVGSTYLSELLGANDGETVVFVKGAVDSLLSVTSRVRAHGVISEITPERYASVERANNDLAQKGLRVLGVAYRVLPDVPEPANVETVERDLVFVGMVGLIDPARPEAKEAVRVARAAGIRPMMITGDHPLTALAIARELGIAGPDDRVLTGQQLARMSVQELEAEVEHVAVFARVSPEHKLNIVQALQNRGHVTAMTGDGVNDAPALKRADIGVAMGITGTAVSKEAADMVIVDDNFATIVSAVEEGRTIYDNVRRFIKYLLASNTGELIVLLATQLIAGMTIPLTTLQILWMNLITDGIPALALGVEKTERGSMTRPPYLPNESLFGRGLGRHILIVGSLLGLTGVALAYWAWSTDIRAANGNPAWNTMVFMFLTIAQMGHALSLRSHRESLFRIGLRGNRLLIGAVVVTVLLQLVAVYSPFFNSVFNTNPLTVEQLILCLVLSSIVFWGVELEKLLMRRGILSQG